MKKFLIGLLIFVMVFCSFPLEVYASGSLDALECPDPNETYGVSSDRYLVWYDYTDNLYHVWFMSNYYYFYFTDGDTSKSLNTSDYYGVFYTLNTSFDEYTACSLTLADVYNADAENILFIYSTHDICVKGRNGGDVFLYSGYQDGYIEDDTETDDTLDEETEGWLSSIFGGIGDIVDGIKNLGKNLQTWLLSLGSSIVSGITDFFNGLLFPEDGYLESKKTELESSFSGLMGFDVSEVESYFGKSSKAETIIDAEETTIKCGSLTFNFKAFDNTWLLVGINKFRSIIRGFVALCLIFFNMNQLLGVIGQSSISSVLGMANNSNNNSNRGGAV